MTRNPIDPQDGHTFRAQLWLYELRFGATFVQRVALQGFTFTVPVVVEDPS